MPIALWKNFSFSQIIISDKKHRMINVDSKMIIVWRWNFDEEIKIRKTLLQWVNHHFQNIFRTIAFGCRWVTQTARRCIITKAPWTWTSIWASIRIISRWNQSVIMLVSLLRLLSDYSIIRICWLENYSIIWEPICLLKWLNSVFLQSSKVLPLLLRLCL